MLFTTATIAKIRLAMSNVGKNVKQLACLYNASGNVKWYNQLGEMVGNSYKVKHTFTCVSTI